MVDFNEKHPEFGKYKKATDFTDKLNINVLIKCAQQQMCDLLENSPDYAARYNACLNLPDNIPLIATVRGELAKCRAQLLLDSRVSSFPEQFKVLSDELVGLHGCTNTWSWFVSQQRVLMEFLRNGGKIAPESIRFTKPQGVLILLLVLHHALQSYADFKGKKPDDRKGAAFQNMADKILNEFIVPLTIKMYQQDLPLRVIQLERLREKIENEKKNYDGGEYIQLQVLLDQLLQQVGLTKTLLFDALSPEVEVDEHTTASDLIGRLEQRSRDALLQACQWSTCNVIEGLGITGIDVRALPEHPLISMINDELKKQFGKIGSPTVKFYSECGRAHNTWTYNRTFPANLRLLALLRQVNEKLNAVERLGSNIYLGAPVAPVLSAAEVAAAGGASVLSPKAPVTALESPRRMPSVADGAAAGGGLDGACAVVGGEATLDTRDTSPPPRNSVITKGDVPPVASALFSPPAGGDVAGASAAAALAAGSGAVVKPVTDVATLASSSEGPDKHTLLLNLMIALTQSDVGSQNKDVAFDFNDHDGGFLFQILWSANIPERYAAIHEAIVALKDFNEWERDEYGSKCYRLTIAEKESLYAHYERKVSCVFVGKSIPAVPDEAQPRVSP